MTKKASYTYEQFRFIANKLKADGVEPSLNLMRTHMGGGSKSTLVEFMDTWRNENDVVKRNNITVSPVLLETLRVELGKAAQVSRQEIEMQYQQLLKSYEETKDFLRISERQVDEITKTLEDDHTEAAANVLNFEKQLSASGEHIITLQRQIEKLEQQLNNSIRAQEVSRTESAKAQLQVERADKAADKAEKQVEVMQEKINQLQGLLHQAEMRAAVAETKLEKNHK